MRIMQSLKKGMAMIAGTLVVAVCATVPSEAAALAKLPGLPTPPYTETLYTVPAPTLNLTAYEGDSYTDNATAVNVNYQGLSPVVYVTSSFVGTAPSWMSVTQWNQLAVSNVGEQLFFGIPGLATMARGTYSTGFEFTGISGNTSGLVEPVSVGVNLEIKASYSFGVSPNPLNATVPVNTPVSYSLSLNNNSGSGKPMDYTLSVLGGGPLPTWLNVSPMTGTLTGNITTVHVGVDPEARTIGDTASVTLVLTTTQGRVVQNNIQIPINLLVVPPGDMFITLSPEKLDVTTYETEVAPDTLLTLDNPSVMDISYLATVSGLDGAINAQPATASVPREGSMNLTVSFPNSNDLLPGEYNGQVNVTTTTLPAQQPIVVPVKMTVKPSWGIGVTPPTTGFDQRVTLTRRSQVAFEIFNDSLSNKSMDYTIESDTPWLKFATRTGRVTNVDRDDVQLTYDSTGLSVGKYNGKFTITANSTDFPARVYTQDVEVSMDVWSPALNELILQPSSVNLSVYETDTPNPSKVTVVNPTDMVLDYKVAVESDDSWILKPVNETGTLWNKTQSSFDINYDTVELASGSYTGKISVTTTTLSEYADYAKDIPVSLTVKPSWEVGITPPASTFDQRVILTRRNQVTFEIYNLSQSDKEMDYTIESTTEWLKFGNKTGRVTNKNRSSVSLTYDAAGKLPGSYTGSFKVKGKSTQFPDRTVEKTVSVKMEVYIPTPDQLTVNPAFLSYVIYETDEIPTATLNVMNPTEMILDYVLKSVSGDTENNIAPWILDPVEAAATVNYKSMNRHTVEFVPQHLLPGVYKGEIDVTSTTLPNTNPLVIPVDLKVLPAFTIATNATTEPVCIDAGEYLDKKFMVWNSVQERDYPMHYHVSTSAPWIYLIGKKEGVVTWNNRDEIEYRLETMGLEPGTYTETIQITAESEAYPLHPASNNVYTIPVTIHVVNVPTVSTVELKTSGVRLGTYPASQTFDVWNAKVAQMPFTVGKVTAATWFTVSPTHFQSNSPIDRQTVTVSYNTADLLPGEYTGQILIQTPTACEGLQRQYVNVTLTVVPCREIATSMSKISFTVPENMTRTLTWDIWNRNPGDPMPFTLTPGASWATFSALSGTAQGTTPQTITITANAEGKAIGSYTSTVTVHAAGAINSPFYVQMEMLVVKATKLGITPSTGIKMSLVQGQTGAANVKVSNTLSTAQIHFFMASDVAWCVPVQASAIASELGVNANFDVSAKNLKPGTYTGKIRLTVPDGACVNAPFEFPVSLTVTAAKAEIALNPTSLSFECVQNEVRTFDFTINNKIGAEPMPFELVSSARWLTVSPASGTTAGTGKVAFKVTVNTTTLLSSQTYRGFITVVAPNAYNTPVSIPVEVNVSDWPSN